MRPSPILKSLRAAVAIASVCVLTFPASASAAAYGYVLNFHASTVSVIDLADNTVEATFTMAGGSSPIGIAFSETGAYIANNLAGTVSMIDVTTGTIEATISVNIALQHIAVSGTGMYVSSTQTNEVSVIDTTTNTVEREISVINQPKYMKASGTGVYVVQDDGNSVAIIDTATQTVERTITVGITPKALDFSGTGAYVSNSGGDSVSIIDTTTNTVDKTVSVGNAPDGVAASGTGVYVANTSDDTVSVIDTTTNTVEATISVGDGPSRVRANNGTVYVMNDNAGTVSVIDADTNTVSATITVGNGPRDMGFGPDLATPEVSFATGALSIAESAGSTTVTLTLSGSTFRDVSIPFTMSGTATDGSDFTATPSPVIINAAETSTGILVSLIDDTDVESAETIIFTLGTPTNAGTGATITHTITLSSEDVASSSSSSSQAAVLIGGGTREVTLQMKQQAAAQRFGTAAFSSASSASPYFTDVPFSAWFHAPVEKLRLDGIVSGYRNADGSDARLYGPDDAVTYGQFAKMIQLLAGREPASMEARLHWAEPYVREARSMELSLFLNEQLNLDVPATRGEVIGTILEAYGIALQALPHNDFTDLPADHPHAKDILTALALGIISGDDDTRTVRPDAPVNRAELAKLLVKVSEKFTPERAISSSSVSSSSSTASSSTAGTALKPAAGADIRTVQTSILNVRADARINAELLWIARQGMEMEVLRIIADDWAHIRVSDGNE